MNWIKEKWIYLMLALLNSIFVIIVLKKCFNIKAFDYKFIAILLASALCLYWVFSFLLKKDMYKFITVFITALVICAMFYFRKSYILMLYHYFEQDLNMLKNLVPGPDGIMFSSVKPISIIIIPLITIILIVLLDKKMTLIALAAVTSMMLYFWYIGYVKEIKSLIFIYILLSLITYSLFEHAKKLIILKKNRVRISTGLILIISNILAVSALVSVITSNLPQNYMGKYASSFQTKLYNQFSYNEGKSIDLAKEKKYDLAQSGYSENNKKLGGPVTLNYNTVLKVKSDKPYYLKGTIKDYYNGYGWQQTPSDYNKLDETFKTLPAVEAFQNTFVRQDARISNKTMIIYPVKNSTSTLFTPSYTYNVIPKMGSAYYNNKFTFINSKISDSFYTVNFYNNSEDISIYSNAYNYKTLFNPYNYDKNSNFLSDTYNYDKYSNYLTVPAVVNDKVYKLAQDIVKNSNNNYEKIKSIDEYLSKNYAYSLDVSNIPPNEEFLDYFLFKEKKGYCTYFATAATIFCRIAGIPAKYVEGYKMVDKKDSEGLYIVTNAEAHAWTEVLINPEKDLWAILDTSPSYNESETPEAQNATASGISTPPGEKNTAGRNNMQRDLLGEEAEGSAKAKVPLWIYIGLGVMTALLMYLIIRILINLKTKNFILKSSSVIPLYKYVIKRIEKINIKGAYSLGELEFINSMEDEVLKERMELLVNSAYEEFYGGKSPKLIDKREFYSFIEHYLKKQSRRIKYYLKRYITW